MWKQPILHKATLLASHSYQVNLAKPLAVSRSYYVNIRCKYNNNQQASPRCDPFHCQPAWMRNKKSFTVLSTGETSLQCFATFLLKYKCDDLNLLSGSCLAS